ncbi:MAG: hypothetical protein WC702_01290 [Patescibacteria group bacterium]|jgi:DNA-directed RNA polymerase alpha subunit
MLETRPYHKSLPWLIQYSEGTIDSTVSLGTFIRHTTLPDNFDEVAEAWSNRLRDQGLDDTEFGVLAFIEEQRKVAEDKKRQQLLDTKLEDLHKSPVLSTSHRVDLGIKTLGGIVARTEAELLEIYGRESFDMIMDELRSLGLEPRKPERRRELFDTEFAHDS